MRAKKRYSPGIRLRPHGGLMSRVSGNLTRGFLDSQGRPPAGGGAIALPKTTRSKLLFAEHARLHSYDLRGQGLQEPVVIAADALQCVSILILRV